MKSDREAVDDFLDVTRKAEALMPRKWITLEGARQHMLTHLLPDPRRLTSEEANDVGRALRGEKTKTHFGGLVAWADRHGRAILIRAFAVGDLPTRGIEHLADAAMVLHDPLPLVWWHRVIDGVDTSVGDEHPFHAPLWIEGAIHRRPADRSEAPLAIATNVQVDYARLVEMAKPTVRAKQLSASITALPWLQSEALRRKQTGGNCSVSALEIELYSQFPELNRDARRKLIRQLPRELRADRGNPHRKVKSSQA